ncbi:hypothetical protein PMAC_001398 [Pneumocystis sp. 'macacae']|nr:hypothetical protein PMAC_001398 [Pneumocystis sp. 'macacae']
MKVLEEKKENKNEKVLDEAVLDNFEKIDSPLEKTEGNIMNAYYSPLEVFLQKSLNGILNNSLYESEIKELKLVARGKVRDVYALDEKQLLFVATDRISAYDVVLNNAIPGKGQILTALSFFWFKKLQHICRHHLIDTMLPFSLQKYAQTLIGRVMVVSKYKILPIEAIVRGYITGSAWKEYVQHGTVHGIALRSGLKQGQAFDTPLFTPSTKATSEGHVSSKIGKKHAKEMERLSLTLYNEAHAYALQKGIIIADTKFEFGVDSNDELVLVDEVLTPDSSRFWPSNNPIDGEPCSLDKQHVRNWLEKQCKIGQVNVILPEEVVNRTRQKYIQVYEQLTDSSWIEHMKKMTQQFVNSLKYKSSDTNIET